MAKAVLWDFSDAKARKRGEQNGLDTRVVHALNNAYYAFVVYDFYFGRFPRTVSATVNTLSKPPGEYGRKAKTQRN